MTTLVHEAQELGRRGFKVHPLRAKDAPYTKYSQTATSDPDAIGVLWKLFPQALIGICTGQGLVVVDDDRRTGIDDDLEPACSMIATTPKGGHHYYFHCATPVRNSTSKLADGVDVRGEGGYVVAPPSEGRTWHKRESDVVGHYLLPLPSVLLAACLRNEPRGGEFEPRSHVPAGERHDYLVRFAGWALANELDTEGPLDTFVLEHAMAVCEPWPKHELAGVARHIAGICRWVIEREQGRG